LDFDPVVLAHARALLTSDAAGDAEYIDADLRDTGAQVAHHGPKLLQDP
jgi:S-adenosyl methyltransferase